MWDTLSKKYIGGVVGRVYRSYIFREDCLSHYFPIFWNNNFNHTHRHPYTLSLKPTTDGINCSFLDWPKSLKITSGTGDK